MLTLDSVPRRNSPTNPFRLSRHARLRTHARRFGVAAIEAALAYGRIAHVRGTEIHAIGWKEVLRFRQRGINLRGFEGIQVVCRPRAGVVLTAYRNRDFRGLRPYRRSSARWRPPVPSVGGEHRAAAVRGVIPVTSDVICAWHRLIVRNCGLHLRKLKADC